MEQPGRKYSAGSGYRYGFNGQEKSEEIGKNLFTALFWEYDARLGKRWNLDPKGVCGISDYSCLGNDPLKNNDLNGDIFKGINKKSANDTKTDIVNYANKVDKSGQLSKYFTIGNDELTFNSINLAAFNKDLKAANLSEDAAGILKGFVSLINDKDYSHYIGLIDNRDNEKINLAGIGLTDDSRKFYAAIDGKSMNEWSKTLPVFNAMTPISGFAQKTSLLIIDNEKSKFFVKYFFQNQPKDFKADRIMIISHEEIGHILGQIAFQINWKKSPPKTNISDKEYFKMMFNASALASVQLYNMYFRSINSKMKDSGSGHNRIDHKPGPPLQDAEKIPDYLKQ